jgi:hypothetical protein
VRSGYRSLIIETSQDNYQAWIVSDRRLDIKQRHALQKCLSGVFHSDPAATGGNQFGRAAGFRNNKPGRGGFCSRISGMGEGGLCKSMLFANTPAAAPSIQPKQVPRGTDQRQRDESAAEFGWVCGMLKAGISIDVVEQRLVEKATLRRGRKDAERYAEITTRKAQLTINQSTTRG